MNQPSMNHSLTNSASDRAKPGRRAFLAATMAATASAAFGREYGPDAPPVRYPEPDVVVLDDRFGKYKLGNSPIQTALSQQRDAVGRRSGLERCGTLSGVE